jgi:hypothetical protein
LIFFLGGLEARNFDRNFELRRSMAIMQEEGRTLAAERGASKRIRKQTQS